MDKLQGAINVLLNYQQADMDGIMVLVSRQAIHEVADAAQSYADLPAKIDELPTSGMYGGWVKIDDILNIIKEQQ